MEVTTQAITSMAYRKAPVITFRASLAGRLLPAVPRRKYAPVSISHESRPDLPASVHASPICPQTSFEHARNFVRVSCGSYHADGIPNHQHEARKVHNLLVYIPLKERIGWSWTCGHLAPARVTCGHIAGFLRTRRSLYTANLRVCGHFYGYGMEYTRILRASYCLLADALRAACDQVFCDL